MKKHLLFLLFAAGYGTASYAQCTPDMSQTQPGIHPTVQENLAPATVGVPYSQTLTVIIPADTCVQIFPPPAPCTVIPISKAVVTNVDGLPSGFTYACNPSNCEFPGGQTNCAVITGTATAGQVGSYPIDIYLTYYAGSIQQEDTLQGYVLNVNLTGNISFSKEITFSVKQNMPNPFDESTSIQYTVPKSGKVEFKVFNLLGKEVYSRQLNATSGDNTYQFNGSVLASGTYLYRISDGSNLATRRMVIR